MDNQWQPADTLPMIDAITDYCGMADGETVLDYCCGRGHAVKGFRMQGIAAYGVDVSRRDIAECEPSVKSFVHNIRKVSAIKTPPRGCYDWLYSKDTLDCVEYYTIGKVVRDLAKICRRAFVVVPLGDGTEYYDEGSRSERSKLALPLDWWEWELGDYWKHVEYSFRVPGIEDEQYKRCPRGRGFFVCTNEGE